MIREEAISEWTFRSKHIKEWLDEYGEEPSIRHYVELIDMAIEALKRKPILCSHCKRYILHDHRCGWWNHGVSNVDWCSYAERREP